MGRLAMSVIQAIRESFSLLLQGEFKEAANSLLNLYKRNFEIISEEANKVTAGIGRANAIWEQSIKDTAEKNLRVQLDAEQQAADAAKKRMKSITEEEQKELDKRRNAP